MLQKIEARKKKTQSWNQTEHEDGDFLTFDTVVVEEGGPLGHMNPKAIAAANKPWWTTVSVCPALWTTAPSNKTNSGKTLSLVEENLF